MNRNWQVELDRARQARLNGNEGKARVCARRAAGMAAREYLQKRGFDLKSPSMIDTLHLLESLPGLAPDLRIASSHLLIRVNEDFGLPTEVDLIADALVVIKGLENHE